LNQSGFDAPVAIISNGRDVDSPDLAGWRDAGFDGANARDAPVLVHRNK
jgi:hypothetical protein